MHQTKLEKTIQILLNTAKRNMNEASNIMIMYSQAEKNNTEKYMGSER